MNLASPDSRRLTDAVATALLCGAFLGHFVIGAGYWWLSPKGFAYNHSRFWLNSVLPFVVMSVAVAGIAGIVQNRRRLVACVAQMFAAGWLGGSIAGRVLFPLSLRGIWGLGFVVAIAGFACSWLLVRQQSLALGRVRIFALLCTLAGVFAVWTQLPPKAATRPLELAAPVLSSEEVQRSTAMLDVGLGARFHPQAAVLELRRGQLRLQCSPILSFDRISPDRFWSLLAPRNIANRKLLPSVASAAKRPHRYAYSDRSTVEILREDSARSIECTAWSEVSEDVYSHLNTFCVLAIEGHENLSLSFSPCADVLIDVLPADYPTGRPARFAYMTEQQEFRVVEASSGEKGPFRLLASGSLKRGDPLAISFFDNRKLQVTLAWQDWTQQLSTQLSPTAGWQVPQNAIEFQCSGDSKNSQAHLYMTLAATSVGRGWETVGHRLGTYRNRVSIQPEPPHFAQ